MVDWKLWLIGKRLHDDSDIASIMHRAFISRCSRSRDPEACLRNFSKLSHSVSPALGVTQRLSQQRHPSGATNFNESSARNFDYLKTTGLLGGSGIDPVYELSELPPTRSHLLSSLPPQIIWQTSMPTDTVNAFLSLISAGRRFPRSTDVNHWTPTCGAICFYQVYRDCDTPF